MLLSLLLGCIAAAVMHLFMYFISKGTESPVNFIEALGSFLTRSLEGAKWIGFALHLILGAVFGYLYALVFMYAGIDRLLVAGLSGIGIGFVHGLIVSYGLMAFVSEFHPLEKFRNATLLVGLVHLAGHCIFGAVLGVLVGIFF